MILWCSIALVAMNLYRAYAKHWDHADPIDLRGLYLGTKMWKVKAPIYNDSVAAKFWQNEKVYGGFESSTDFGDEWVSIMVYPPQAFVITYPISMYRWKRARILWWGVISLSLLLFCYLLYAKTQSFLYPLLVLGSSASFFALSLGQPMLIVLTALFLAVLFQDKHHVWAGIFLGIAMIKFNLAIPFALWFMIRSKYKVLMIAAITCILMFSLVWMSYPNILVEYTQKVSDYYNLIYTIHPRNIYTFSDSEFSMFLNYYLQPDIAIWKTINSIAQLLLYGIFFYAYKLKKLNQDILLLAFLLTSFVFSYHLAYDVLLFFIPLVMIAQSNVKNALILLLIILSLPINAIAGNLIILKFNYSILMMLALIVFIFALIKGKFEDSRTHITH